MGCLAFLVTSLSVSLVFFEVFMGTRTYLADIEYWQDIDTNETSIIPTFRFIIRHHVTAAVKICKRLRLLIQLLIYVHFILLTIVTLLLHSVVFIVYRGWKYLKKFCAKVGKTTKFIIFRDEEA